MDSTAAARGFRESPFNPAPIPPRGGGRYNVAMLATSPVRPAPAAVAAPASAEPGENGFVSLAAGVLRIPDRLSPLFPLVPVPPAHALESSAR